MPHVLLLLCGHLTPISYLEGSTLHCSRVSLGSDTDMVADLDLGLLPGAGGAAAAGPAVEKEAAAAAMPAATQWDDWETRFRELYVQNLA